MIDMVLKVGGSLAAGTGLGALCSEMGRLGGQRGLLLVPGGGVYADTVRSAQARDGFSDEAAHWMAVAAMEQFGLELADLVRGAVVRELASAEEVIEKGCVPVLLPGDLLRREDPLPHSWDVTSDSIAAWVAALARSRLVLLKHPSALTSSRGGALTSARLDADSAVGLARRGVIDAYLAHQLQSQPVDAWIVAGAPSHELVELVLSARDAELSGRRRGA